MCKIVTKDSHGRVSKVSLETMESNVVRVSEFGVYESGVRRSVHMSLKFSRSFSSPVRPFNIK